MVISDPDNVFFSQDQDVSLWMMMVMVLLAVAYDNLFI